jgi:hypothetical protein
VRRGHANVDDGDSGLVHRDVAKQVLGVVGLRDDLEARVAEEARDPFSEENRVVSQRDRDPRAEHGDRVAQGWEVAREVVREELVDPLGSGEPREPVLSEVARGDTVELVERLGGEHDLRAVARVRDPRRAHDVESRVALLRERRRAGVESDPDAHADVARPLRVTEGPLNRERCLRRCTGVREGGDVLVPHRVRLGTPARGDLVPDEPSEQRDRIRVVLRPLALEHGRALDVREEEGHRSGWQRVHGSECM